MRVLLSCVNSLVSLVGYDTEAAKAFWYCPGNMLRACGACYDGHDLLLASDEFVTRITPQGVRQHKLPGPHTNLAHSVHHIGGMIGVVDTGNSRILIQPPDSDGAVFTLDPLEGWPDRPMDAIHLNDFMPWGEGVIASCFHYHPFGHYKTKGYDWHGGGHGLILGMHRAHGMTVSKVLASGLNCPHSLVEHEGAVYCCSSSRGELLKYAPQPSGLLYESARWKITGDHFVRGALHDGERWLLGGSSVRRLKEQSPMSLYLLDEATGKVERQTVAAAGEIYDVLPWDDAIMRTLVPVINALPSNDWDENEYPKPMGLPDF
ncbi:hypothetical protein LN040_13800 [Desulfovibrio subterraneus]|uniref:hypothetical protein n=1 Tax=Desulfovibrio subterraneus TaxID=2718620 RepID=UPI0022B8D872|nr:hypothetical protein [Desulfovibrio subterraneus]WBF66786.1 hypothetical protein LN040_13800 [Desulfovibrio subterraneus]